MSAEHRGAYIRSQADRLYAIRRLLPDIKEYEEHIKLTEVKIIAKEMSIELNMPEALENWQSSARLSPEQISKFNTAVSMLTLACDKFESLEDYPHRQKMEIAVRAILNL